MNFGYYLFLLQVLSPNSFASLSEANNNAFGSNTQKVWSFNHRSWLNNHRSWSFTHNSWLNDHGSWSFNHNSWLNNNRFWLFNHKSWSGNLHVMFIAFRFCQNDLK